MVNKKNIIYVCSAFNGSIISCKIPSSSKEEAENRFLRMNGIKPEVTLGPFTEKKERKLAPKIDYKNIKITNVSKKCIYDGWYVNAIILSEPENMAFLTFDKRVDGAKVRVPKNIDIVSVGDLIFTNE